MAILFISWTLGFSFLGFYKGQLVSYKDLHNDQVEHIKYEFVEPTSVDMKINDKELKESSKVDEKPSKSKRW